MILTTIHLEGGGFKPLSLVKRIAVNTESSIYSKYRAEQSINSTLKKYPDSHIYRNTEFSIKDRSGRANGL